MRIAEGKLWKCFMQKGNRRSKAGKPASEAKGEFSFLNHTGRKTQSLNKFPRLPAYLPINCSISNLAIHISILVNLSSISNPTITYPPSHPSNPYPLAHPFIFLLISISYVLHSLIHSLFHKSAIFTSISRTQFQKPTSENAAF